MSIAIDASTPAAVSGTASSSFSPPANSGILIACASPLDVTNTSLGDNQSALTYTKLVSHSTSTDVEAELWFAFAASALTGLVITPSGGSQFIAPIVLTGVSSTQNGPTNGTGSFGAAPSVTVTRNANSRAGSLMVGVVGTRSAIAPTFPGGQTDVFGSQTLLAVVSGDDCWAQQISALTADATTAQTINVTAPSAEFAMVGAEILPGASAGNPGIAPQIISGHSTYF